MPREKMPREKMRREKMPREKMPREDALAYVTSRAAGNHSSVRLSGKPVQMPDKTGQAARRRSRYLCRVEGPFVSSTDVPPYGETTPKPDKTGHASAGNRGRRELM